MCNKSRFEWEVLNHLNVDRLSSGPETSLSHKMYCVYNTTYVWLIVSFHVYNKYKSFYVSMHLFYTGNTHLILPVSLDTIFSSKSFTSISLWLMFGQVRVIIPSSCRLKKSLSIIASTCYMHTVCNRAIKKLDIEGTELPIFHTFITWNFIL